MYNTKKQRKLHTYTPQKWANTKEYVEDDIKKDNFLAGLTAHRPEFSLVPHLNCGDSPAPLQISTIKAAIVNTFTRNFKKLDLFPSIYVQYRTVLL